MATKISWCDETINPVVGCSKISAGCQNCYAENMARRLAAMGLDRYGKVVDGHYTNGEPFKGWNDTTAFVPSELEKPYKWRKPRTVFVSSMGDLFHKSVWRCWIDDVMRMVANNSQHTFIFLTKRPERMKEYFDLCDRELVGELTAVYQLSHGTDPHNLAANWPLPNLVLGVSVEDQQTADERITVLRKIPASKIFVSLEPMIGSVDLGLTCIRCGHLTDAECPGSDYACRMIRPLDGVILGGESGNKARRLDPQWAISVRDQCKYAGVPFMFKQWDYGNRNEVDERGFPYLQDNRTHSELAWNVNESI